MHSIAIASLSQIAYDVVMGCTHEMQCNFHDNALPECSHANVETNQETNESILSTRDGSSSMRLCTANVFNMQKASSRLPTFVCTQLLMRWASSCNLDWLGGKSASALVRWDNKIIVAPNTALHRNASSVDIAWNAMCKSLRGSFCSHYSLHSIAHAPTWNNFMNQTISQPCSYEY